MSQYDGPVILFQGDSITDAGRNRDDGDDLGRGYAAIAAAWYQALFPERRARFINRGIGGNKVPDLLGRWKPDCLDLKPDLVSILVGINDTWRSFDSGQLTTPEQFEKPYREILIQTKDSGAEIIIIEPFVLPHPEDRRLWRKDLDPKIQIVRDLARDFGAAFVPLDGLFAQAAARREPEFWAADGVHPTPPGHALIAQAWLDVAQDLI